MPTDIVLRDLTTVEECQKVVEMERAVWGYADSLDVVPVPILIVTVKRGGILVGAFGSKDEMVGFVYSLPALKNGRPTQWSHMLGVLDAWRNSGVGRRLKLEQRQRALDMGLDLVEWTFDPLQAMNAHLNFTKLGVVAEEYEENIYGASSSPLHRGTPTDRLVAQWWIRHPRVADRISGTPAATDQPPPPARVVNRVEPSGRWLACKEIDLSSHSSGVLVEIPMGFGEMLMDEPRLARDWRFATRELFVTYFTRGYQAVDFFLDRAKRKGTYLLVDQHRATAHSS